MLSGLVRKVLLVKSGEELESSQRDFAKDPVAQEDMDSGTVMDEKSEAGHGERMCVCMWG